MALWRARRKERRALVGKARAVANANIAHGRSPKGAFGLAYRIGEYLRSGKLQTALFPGLGGADPDPDALDQAVRDIQAISGATEEPDHR